MKLKRVMAVVLAAALTFSMTACGSKDNADPTPAPTGTTNNENNNNNNSNNNNTSKATNDEIIIGTWWTQPYDSNSTSMDESEDWKGAQDKPDDDDAKKTENALNRQICQYKWDNVKTIEEKYGVKFWWENLTYAGVKDSINTSILAGTPDCDVYLVDTGMAIPAQVNGLALDLKTVLPADHDLFTTQKIASYLDLGDGKACIFYKTQAQTQVEATYPLGFNVQLLEEYNLEDPRDLYERGEWTWDKFIEYCQVLTQDTDGDGQVDQYGYCGYEYETFEQLMMSNGGSIAMSTTENLSSSNVAEALQMMSDMYNTYNICYPYDFEGNASDSMRIQYMEGNIGFFPIACWIAANNKNYSVDSPDENLTWDTAYVRWPVGPSGNQETNYGKNLTSGEFYIIPAGVAEPEKVFNVMYDLWNWAGDVETTIQYRDDKAALNWWYNETAHEEELQNANFACMQDCGAHAYFDLWNSMSIGWDLQSIVKGTMTPAQFQETYKQVVQDALDSIYGN